jgi:hypothetical protein
MRFPGLQNERGTHAGARRKAPFSSACFFKRSFKRIKNSIFVNKLYNNIKLPEEEFIKMFEEYCLKNIKFPIFKKYFWV